MVLRAAAPDDREALVGIRSKPEVRDRWRGDDLETEFDTDLVDPELHLLVIADRQGGVLGAVQWSEETDPDYRHASMDIYLDPAVHGRGIGTDAIRTLARHLFDVEHHHRLVIDPAADNMAAIRSYEKAGFRLVGVMRQYERGEDGRWHDGLLMELLADDFHTAGPGDDRS